jgi:hypothetical protein
MSNDKCFDLLMQKNDECEILKLRLLSIIEIIEGEMDYFNKLNSIETICRREGTHE